jgi:MFS family permease
MKEKAKSPYTPQFWLLCFSLFLFLGSFNLLIPELPAYLRELGGEQYLGLIISLFALTAGLSRPLSGKLTDRIGRIPVMLFGVAVSVICGVMYTLVAGVLGFFIVRLLHGISAGFTPTANTSLLTDIIPEQRRGEAMGIVGIATSMGMAVGPPLGSLLAMHFSHDVMFIASSASASLSLVMMTGIRETLKQKEPFRAELLWIKKDEVIDRDVLAPATVMALTIFCFGLLLTIVPDYSEFLGMENKGVFFTYFLVASLLVRITSGRASDRYGRQQVLKVGVFLQLIAMLVMALIQTKTAFLVSGVIFGLGSGIVSPTIFAWTADLAQSHQRGKAMSTLFLALEIGIFFGAIISGFLYGNESSRFPVTFMVGAAFALISLVYLVKRWPAYHRS